MGSLKVTWICFQYEFTGRRRCGKRVNYQVVIGLHLGQRIGDAFWLGFGWIQS